MTRRGFLWTVTALLGIGATAALTWSVSRLAGERIGLSSAPLSVIHGLAPPRGAAVAGAGASRRDRPGVRGGAGRAGAAVTTPGGSALAPAAQPAASPPSASPPSASPPAASPAAPAGAGPLAPSPVAGSARRNGDNRDDSNGGSAASSPHRDD
jgi:hypothetical protein